MHFDQTCIQDKTTVFLANTIGLEKKLVPEGFESAASYLKELVVQGMKKRYPKVADTNILMKRIEDELYQIVCGSQENYFLIVYDYVSWAKKQGILCSPGRSTAQSSIICYCLGITEIDPIENDLIFERFCCSGKSVSIYLDVDYFKKDLVVGYISEKYADYGVVISSSDDENYIELLCNLSNMSFSITGIEILSELNNAQQMIQKNDSSFSLNSIPENDSDTLKMIRDGDADKVFQLESPGIQKYLKMLPSLTFDNLMALTSMYRPGSFQFVSQYIDGKLEKSEIAYLDDSLKGILSPTYGIIIYQEQLMQILHDYAGFDNSEADEIRRIMQKKQLKKHPELKEIFVSKAQKQGHGSTLADKVFDFLYEFAGYAFPKCHALGQTKITYWHAYIKCHYPEVFTSASCEL